MNSVMNGIEEKQLTKIWLNVFKDFFKKTLLWKIFSRKMMGFDNKKKFLEDLDLLIMKKNINPICGECLS